MYFKGYNLDWEKEEQKTIIKEAFKEWLDERAAEFGKWTFKWIAIACMGALVTFLVTHGYLK